MIQEQDQEKVKEFLVGLRERMKVVDLCSKEKKLIYPWDYHWQLRQLINVVENERGII